MKSNPHNLFSKVRRFFSGRVKKYLFFTLLTWGASYGLLGSPFAVQASVFNFFTFLFEGGAASDSVAAPHLNSQTISLLEPAVNLDPTPARGGGDIALVDGEALASEGGPSPGEAQIPAGSSQISIYTVREGDTLSEIAQMFNVSVNTIVWANDIQGRVIHPGQELVILPVTGISHTVQKGETLASIAKKYGSDADEIATYNELTSATLTVGSTIIIPNGEVVAPTPAPSSSSGSSGGIALPPTTSGGTAAAGYYHAPLAHYVRTQGIHGYNGVDLAGPKGSAVMAAADGVVIVARQGGWNGGYGNYVVISHPNGTQTLYAHESSITVSVGQRVSQGQTIGYEGMTGKATGYHVHFEVRGARNPF